MNLSWARHLAAGGTWADGSAAFTFFSLFHLVSGVLCQIVCMRLWGLSAWAAGVVGIVVHTTYEAKDAYLTYGALRGDKKRMRAAAGAVRATGRHVSDGWFYNSLLNSTGDTISFIVGSVIGAYLAHKVDKEKARALQLLLGASGVLLAVEFLTSMRILSASGLL